jgi:spermidine/putrescine transport system substrate-binding protein
MKTLTALLAILGGFALAGCDKPPIPPPHPSDAAKSTPQAPTATTATAESHMPTTDKLNLFCWSEYIPQAVIDQFAQETGIKVTVTNFGSNEEMLAKLMAGGENYDIIQPSQYALGALVKDALLHPIDPEKIPNLKNIAPAFLGKSSDPDNRFSIPFLAGTVGIVVNTDLVKDDIRGYSDVFQEKFNQRIVGLDDPREIVTWGFITQGTPINDVTDENLAKVRPLLEKWLPLVKVFDSDSPKTALLNGDVALGVVWGGEGAKLLDADKKFKWIAPAEGSHLFVDSLAVPKTATHVKNAQMFMNFILRPDISVKISDEFPYLNPNAAARALLTEAQRNNPASFPSTEELANMKTFKDIGEQASKVDELVTSLKAQ